MRTFSLSLAPMALLWSQGAFAAPPEWQVSEITGTVRLTHEGETRTAQRGARLAPGDIVATAPGARAVIVRGQEYVIVSANSQLRLPAAARSGGVTQIIEDFGNAVYRITKKATPHFGVETPYLAAVVKGTTFSVTVGPEGASVQVIEGVVEVATNDGGARELIEPGVIALVGASDRYRLTVEGADRRVIDSPARPADAERSAPSADPESPADPAATGGQVISMPIAEDGPALASLTGGLVQGDAGIELAFAAVSAARAEAILTPSPGNEAPGRGDGNGGDSSGSGGNGNGGGNDSSGPGNDNGGGNGSGDAGGGDPGPGNNNGGGNDNFGPGNNNGNGNTDPGGGNDNSGRGNNNGNGNTDPGGGGDNSGPGDNNGNGNTDPGNDNSGPGNNNGNTDPGGGNDNSGPDNNNGNGNTDPGGGNDNSGPGNNNGNGNTDPGGGNDNSGPGNNNGNGGGDGPEGGPPPRIAMGGAVPELENLDVLPSRAGTIADSIADMRGRAGDR